MDFFYVGRDLKAARISYLFGYDLVPALHTCLSGCFDDEINDPSIYPNLR